MSVRFLELQLCLCKSSSLPDTGSPPGGTRSCCSEAGSKGGLDPGPRPARKRTIREGGGRCLQARVAAGERRRAPAQAADDSLRGAARGTKAKGLFNIRTSATSACKPSAHQGRHSHFPHPCITTGHQLHFSAVQNLRFLSSRAPSSAQAAPPSSPSPPLPGLLPLHPATHLGPPAPPHLVSPAREPWSPASPTSPAHKHTLPPPRGLCPQTPTQLGAKTPSPTHPDSQPHHRLPSRARFSSTANKPPLPPRNRLIQPNRTRLTGSGNASLSTTPPSHAPLPPAPQGLRFRVPTDSARPLLRILQCFLHHGWLGLKHERGVLKRTGDAIETPW